MGARSDGAFIAQLRKIGVNSVGGRGDATSAVFAADTGEDTRTFDVVGVISSSSSDV